MLKSGNRTGWRRARHGGALAGLLLLAAALLLPGLDRQALTREQELRVACTARTMAEGGNWLLPRYMEELRLKKPPLMYWIVAAGMMLADAEESPWAARLPTALFGVALIGLIYQAGARLIGRRRAMAGALAAACSILFLRFGRLGETDIPLAFFTTAAIFLLGIAMERPRAFIAWMGVGACAGLGFMIKGPAALLLPALTAVGYLAVSRPARQSFAPAGPALAVAVFVLLAAPWYLYLFLAPGAQDAAQAAVGSELSALVVKTGHAAPLGYYFYTLPYALLPLGPLLLPALYRTFRRFRHHARIRFLLVWLTMPLLAMSLIKSKQIHYATLLLPQASLLIGLLLGGRAIARPWPSYWTARYLKGLFALCAALGVALAVAPFRYPELNRALLMAGGLGLAALAGWAFGLRADGRHALNRLATLAGLLAALAPLYLYGGMMDMTDGDEAIPEFAQEIENKVQQAPRAYYFGAHRNSFEFYLDRDLAACTNFAEAWNRAQPGDVVIVRQERGHRGAELPMGLFPSREMNRRDVHLAFFIHPPDALPDAPL